MQHQKSLKRHLLLGFAALGSILLLGLQPSGTAAADDPPVNTAAPSASSEEMMKLMMKLAQPGPNHKLLESLSGKWALTTRMWMGPGTPTTEAKGTAERKMILGGRYMQEEVHGEMMGQPFHGMSITGFDNYKKQFSWFWVDSMGTGTMTSLGTPDETGKVLTFWGEADCPMTGEKGKKIKSILRFDSTDKQVFEMYDKLPDGTEWKMLEVTYTRRK